MTGSFSGWLWFHCALVTFSLTPAVYVEVLGTAQDAGYPQAGCRRECCQRAWQNPELQRFPTSIAVVESQAQRRWLFECTPQFTAQLHLLDQRAPVARDGIGIDGIFLTHAHIGHYAGLMFLGREVIGAQRVPVYGMPRMLDFLSTQAPWRQLVTLANIELHALQADEPTQVSPQLTVTPLVVPHRDEFSETVAYVIQGPTRQALFLPDIDKWERWDRQLETVLKQVDYALIDATFFDGDELPGRNLAEIPHPLVIETLARLKNLSEQERNKIYLIHFNHTNPLLNPDSPVHEQLRAAGIKIADQSTRLAL